MRLQTQDVLNFNKTSRAEGKTSAVFDSRVSVSYCFPF